MNKPNPSKRPWGTRIILLIGSLLILFCGAFTYARFIEPNMLSITNHVIKSSNLPESFHHKKIVQISDIHLGDHYSTSQLNKLVQQINAQKPDIVVFTGDLIDNYHEYSGNNDAISSALKNINAPLGKFAIYGNHDRGGGASRHYGKIMENGGFTVLVNESQEIRLPSKEKITISGLDDFLLGNPKIKGTLGNLDEKLFNLLIVHEPDVVDRLQGYPIDLQLSGHSHGGQVKLPGDIALVTVPLARKYLEGMYSVPGKGRMIQLYVNRGIGTTREPLRMFSTPEISVFTLEKIS
ncbi:metallophosphoesterase [Paenibacillus sp. N1-5-1-14]|uniref:metallophosphoesterase n=1 Tax=Paenibacillus radicibacter TaxID=2972488 RepID=UPI002158E917|nr:metallophosphoesterase [Paenibacillus radicibacter]MCR8645988.1 metallophosphoesterase [Paenibacillus radicibacter]